MNLSVFDLDEWTGRYSEQQLRTFSQLGITHSPINIVAGEYFRSLAANKEDFGPTVPTDVFLFSKGDSPLPHLTKIGGVPYRPRGLAWPQDCHGCPMVFLAQICFAESKDHIGQLPGDVLVIFAQMVLTPFWSRPSLSFEYDESLYFEWHRLGIEDVMPPEDVPASPRYHVNRWPPAPLLSAEPSEPPVFPQCYGSSYRTVDYVDTASATRRLDELVPNVIMPKAHPIYRHLALYSVSRYGLTKVGGCPLWYSDTPPQVAGRFIAGFAGMIPAIEVSYPWMNEESPIPLRGSLADDIELRIGDPGYLNLFFDDTSQHVEWQLESLH